MKCKKEGRKAATDTLHLGKSPLFYASQFPYLELLFSASGRSFTAHVSEKCREVAMAIWTIKSPHRLSFAPTLSLFNLKVAPSATCRICVIWKDCIVENVKQLNRVKASFLKKALELHKIVLRIS